METPAATPRIARFGVFEAHLSSGLLTRHGLRVKIEVQPFHVLILLLSRPGEIITREQIRHQLWPNGTYVDFEGSLNAALKKLRAALNDDPKQPRFIETVPKRGYRFIVPVTFPGADSTFPVRDEVSPGRHNQFLQPFEVAQGEHSTGGWRARARENLHRGSILLRRNGSLERLGAFATLAFVAVVVVVGIARTRFGGEIKAAAAGRPKFVRSATPPASRRPSIAVLGFRNLSGNKDDKWLATALAEMLSTELGGRGKLRLVTGEDIANLSRSFPWPIADSLDAATTARIGSALDSDYLVLGSYTALGPSPRGKLRIDARLQDAITGKILAESAVAGDEKDLFEIVARLGDELRNGLGIPALNQSDEIGMMASLPLDPETARFYALGLERLRTFDASAAKDLFEQAVEADPKFSLAHVMLARAWEALGYEQNQKEEAEKAFRLSKDLPQSERLLVEGDYYESLGNHEKAASVYHALFELYPDNLDYGLQLAKLQFESYGPEPALETMRQLRRLPSPLSDNPDLDLGEADILIYKDATAADRLFRNAAAKALAQGRELAYAQAEKGICYTNPQHLQSPPECQVAYNIYVQAGNLDAAASCLRILAEKNRLTGHEQAAIPLYEQAERLFRRLGDRLQAGIAINNLSIVLEDEGQWRRAEAAFRQAALDFQAVNDRMRTAVAVANIADMRVLRGDFGQAEAMYRRASEIDDSAGRNLDQFERINLASLLLMQGKLKEAREEIEAQVHAQRVYAQDPCQLAYALAVLGDVEKASGNLDVARKNYQEAVGTFKKEKFAIGGAGAQVSLAELETDQGHPEQAAALLGPAIAEFKQEQSAGEEISAYAALARALLAQGKAMEAQDAVAHALRLADLREFPVLLLPLQILEARAAVLGAGSGPNRNRALVNARKTLRVAVKESHEIGLYIIECQARLALGELEMKLDPAAAQSGLRALAEQAGNRGMALIAKQAADLRVSVGPAPTQAMNRLTASAARREQ